MTYAIQMENFSYKYPDGTAALDNITLNIEHNVHTAVIGPNGAGKSTLLLAMAGLIGGTGGLLIEGLEPTRKNHREIRRRIGCCLQSPDDQLFMPTLEDDIGFGLLNIGMSAEQAQKGAQQALKKVGLAGFGNKMPHHLSAGQKRAAAIATIVAMNPAIITLDEPDSSLDPRQRNNLLGLLSSLDQTLIIATCSMNFAACLCDQAVLLDQGRLIMTGPAKQIMTDESLMKSHGLESPFSFG
ncbi:MAG: ATP-binding cassette domain-containing protein [Planctomycetota bacterium]